MALYANHRRQRASCCSDAVSVGKLHAFHPPFWTLWAPKRHGCWWLIQAFDDHSFVVQRLARECQRFKRAFQMARGTLGNVWLTAHNNNLKTSVGNL